MTDEQLAVVTWLELLPHRSVEVISTCQQHQARSKEGALSSRLTQHSAACPCLARTGTQAGRQATLEPPPYGDTEPLQTATSDAHHSSHQEIEPIPPPFLPVGPRMLPSSP